MIWYTCNLLIEVMGPAVRPLRSVHGSEGNIGFIHGRKTTVVQLLSLTLTNKTHESCIPHAHA